MTKDKIMALTAAQEPCMTTPKPVQPGDMVDFWCGQRRVVRVEPYTGLYRHHFNVTLVLYSPNTASGAIRMAFNDLALRK